MNAEKQCVGNGTICVTEASAFVQNNTMVCDNFANCTCNGCDVRKEGELVVTSSPTRQPTPAPTSFPSPAPSKSPSKGPTVTTTAVSNQTNTNVPTVNPTIDNRTSNPTQIPTPQPTSAPTSTNLVCTGTMCQNEVLYR